MGMIKRADLEDYARDACVMDLGDLEKRGAALVEAANNKATQIIENANLECEQLVSAANKKGQAEGFKQGHDEGFKQGLEEGAKQARDEHAEQLAQLLGMWTEQLGHFEQHRDAMLEAARVQVVELAAAIAGRVVRRQIELDPAIVMTQVESVLSAVTETTRLVIRVHPDDAERVSAELPAMVDRFASCEHAQVITDPSIEPGSCLARTSGGGTIDASLRTQLDRIVSALLPGTQSGVASPGIEQEQDESAGNDGSQSSSEHDDRQDDAA